MQLINNLYGVDESGHKSKLLRITNASGAYIEVTDYGAKLVSVVVPDRHGKLENVVLGYKNLEDAIKGHRFFGSNPGRYAGRIRDGRFTRGGKTFELTKNSGKHHLHGGEKGLDSVFWRFHTGADEVVFSYTSPDGEEGYPGTLKIQIGYRWSEDNKLTIRYTAVADAETPVNLTHHSYFNLAGDRPFNIYDQYLKVNSDRYLELDAEFVPTGNILSAAGSELDLTAFRRIGDVIDSAHPAVKNVSGLDQCFVFETNRNELREQAVLQDRTSGRSLTVSSDYPGLQVYSGNFCESETPVQDGRKVPLRAAMCLEAQNFPNSPNIETFPSAWLRPGERYEHQISYHFETFV